MKRIKQYLLSAVVASTLVGCASSYDASTDSSSDGYRRVGHVVWNKAEEINAESLLNQGVPSNSVGVFFFRPEDGGDADSSTNIAINGRFQTSLQPGFYSHVYSCSGINDLSVDFTSRKHNNLKRGVSAYSFDEGNSYFFGVDARDPNGVTLRQVSQDVALNAMQGMRRQAHQISRVVPNCAPAPARIELNVLFDTNKAIVKPFYYSELERVANYMTQNSNVTAVLEGHTDSRASDRYNMALSQRRVDSVMRLLIERFGVDAMRLRSVGYGERRPIAPNDTPENMQKNRRVIAVFSNN